MGCSAGSLLCSAEVFKGPEHGHVWCLRSAHGGRCSLSHQPDARRTSRHLKCLAQPILSKPSWSRLLRPAGQRLLLRRRRLIAPLPEGFAIDAPVAGPQTTQPVSARAKASKRPAPEGASSSSRQVSPPRSDPQPDPPTFWDYGPPLTMFSGNPNRPPIGSHPHPYQRTSSAPAGKTTGKGKGTPTLTYADIANKGKKGQKGGKGQKRPKGPKGTQR